MEHLAAAVESSSAGWTVRGEAYSLAVDAATGCLAEFHDQRDPEGIFLTDRARRFCSLCYTLREDDITRGEKPRFTPYVDREAVFSDGGDLRGNRLEFRNGSLNAMLRYEFFADALRVEAFSENPALCEFGLNLPFCFLGRKGTPAEYEFLPSTPYVSCDGALRYWYLSRPGGHPLLLTYLSGADGWKLDYSPDSFGHFIRNLKVLGSYDRAYGAGPHAARSVRLEIRFPTSFEAALRAAARTLDLPVVRAEVYGVPLGRELELHVTGKCDALHVLCPDGREERLALFPEKTRARFRAEHEGIYAAVPYCGGRRGLDCRIFVYESLPALFRRNCLSIRRPWHIDDNLCEGGVWAEALCRNMRLMGRVPALDAMVREQLRRVIPARGTPLVPRCSIPPYPAGGLPAFHIYASLRVQEQFFGVSFLLQAYRLYHDRRLLENAVSAMLTLLQRHFENGKIIGPRLPGRNDGQDYTTVTAPVIAVVDLARVLRAEGDARFRLFEEAAVQTADYLVRRGLDFPTEGEENSENAREMEDGSISCTALSVLYVCYYVRPSPHGLAFARRILRLHDAWIIRTPDARLFHSTLRWWETIWEGDADGPAICGGHAWTVWRAEADYYAALLTFDTGRLLDSYNGFMTNLAKIGPDGRSYSCFQPDDIPGGGDTVSSADVVFRRTAGFPARADQSLSKYVWTRLEDSWFKTAALVRRRGSVFALNAKLVSGPGDAFRLKPDLPDAVLFYLDAGPCVCTICTRHAVEILTLRELRAEPLYNPVRGAMGSDWFLTPQSGRVCFRIV